jgi:hypothetical protein
MKVRRRNRKKQIKKLMREDRSTERGREEN